MITKDRPHILFNQDHHIYCSKCKEVQAISFEYSGMLFCNFVKSFIKKHKDC